MKIFYHYDFEHDRVVYREPEVEPSSDAIGWVYFLAQGDSIKVGYSKDPTERLKRLQTGANQPLRLLCCLEAAQSMETWLHRELKAFRVSGEWFEAEAVRRWLRIFLRDADGANELIF